MRSKSDCRSSLHHSYWLRQNDRGHNIAYSPGAHRAGESLWGLRCRLQDCWCLLDHHGWAHAIDLNVATADCKLSLVEHTCTAGDGQGRSGPCTAVKLERTDVVRRSAGDQRWLIGCRCKAQAVVNQLPVKLGGVLLDGVYVALVQKVSSNLLTMSLTSSFAVPLRKLWYRSCKAERRSQKCLGPQQRFCRSKH